ncbi:ABC transporter ATP-binding protein [Flavobacteriales bacterium]|jgi:peptide/nickel transport system ATP-binding protein|nr:ABC transporter ATP-binding protein [Flavobacteriales bacterium]MDC3395123.1 ABC transporter ATP-binding protein [Flavobacteriales bacterium]MDG1348368.1 ABC transporter ATP-binding protein [Flavobacteriales bacterium]
MENTLLEFKNLVTEFHTEGTTVKAVNGVSFTLNKGETIGIVGESGSGKSVTSLSAMRLIPSPPGKISGGEIIFHKNDGTATDLLKISEEEMRKFRGNDIAMIFQEPMTSLNPVFTCGDQVMEAIMLHQKLDKKAAKALTIKLFEEVQLPTPERIFSTYPHQISGGQKQRVMIAMAMSCQPSVLIADEPTTALDVTVQKTILQLMQNLQKEHDMGIMFITHDLGVIAELADKVVVMYKGNIVEQGNVWDIFTNPKHPYTKGLLACRPPLDKRYTFLPTVSDFMKIDESGEIIDNGISVAEFTKDLAIPESERVARHKELYAKEPIMQIKNLKTYFPIRNGFFGGVSDHVKAVDNISFDVYPGETLGLVGESGCGKTTCGRTIIRLEEPTEGKMIYKGQDIAKMNADELRVFRKDVQIIFQDPYSSLNPRMTIGNAIMEPMQVHGILENDEQRKKRVEELLTRVSLDPAHFYRYPHEFSGGQRQRIGIARALAVNPKFIICDESVSALDVSVQAQVLNLLNELKEEFGLTYIFISHDLSVVKYMSDRMVVMQAGKIEEMGDADQIYNKPGTPYTQKLIDAIPEGKLEDIKRHLESKGVSVS